MRKSAARVRGFTLTELLAAIPCLVVVSVIGTQLLRDVVRVDASSAEASNYFSRSDAAVDRLRRDMWGCHGIRVSGGKEVRLTVDGEGDIFWKIEKDGTVTRTEGAATMKWEEVGKGWSFSLRDVYLVVVADLGGGNQEMVLMSQMMVIGSGER
jgi:type II secretory pathway component PulJ